MMNFYRGSPLPVPKKENWPSKPTEMSAPCFSNLKKPMMPACHDPSLPYALTALWSLIQARKTMKTSSRADSPKEQILEQDREVRRVDLDFECVIHREQDLSLA